MRDLVPPSALNPTLAPFSDPNFKLAVISELIENRTLDFGNFVEFLTFIEGPDYDYEKGGHTPSEAAYDYLARYPLAPRHLARATFLEFDGGLAVYPYVYPFWDGQDALFDIQSLKDMRHLSNLRRLNVVSMLQDTDLKPLRTASSLERISLGPIGTWDNLDALLGLPRLTHLTLFKSNLKRWFRNPVLEVLRERGVQVNLL